MKANAGLRRAGPVVAVWAAWWALAGGALLTAVVLLTAASAASNLFFDAPIPGDFEAVKIGVAVAVFAFLPHCQLSGANVRADLFAARLGPTAQTGLALLESLVVCVFSALLLWRMSLGLLDYRSDGEITHILEFPVYLAFPPMLLSLALLLMAGVATALECGARLAGGTDGARQSTGE